MSQISASRCFYCGLLIDPQKDDFCPNCHYPASPGKEEAYLTSMLASLQQAMSFGGAQLNVAELYQRSSESAAHVTEACGCFRFAF